MIRLRTLLPLVAFVAAACSLVPAELQRELLPSNTSYKTAEAAYQVLIERHIDKPTSQTLLTGALGGVVTEAKKEGASDSTLPSAGLNLTGSTWSDFAKFSDRLDAIVAATPNANKKVLESAAVDGMAKSLNECHTYYLDPSRAKNFNQPQPPVSGIGVQINKPSADAPIEVVRVYAGTPAQRAGIKAGDKIVTVDGVDVVNLQTEEVANKVKGPEGTPVSIGILRGQQALSFTLNRARFSVLILLPDIPRNSRCAGANRFSARRHRGGHIRSGSMRRNRPRNGFQRLRCAFHHVVPARAMNVYVQETWRSAPLICRHFLRSCGQRHPGARADLLNYPIANQNSRVADFRRRCVRQVGVQKYCAHGQNFILTEFHSPAKKMGGTGVPPISPIQKKRLAYFAAADISMLVSFRFPPSTLPFTVT